MTYRRAHFALVFTSGRVLRHYVMRVGHFSRVYRMRNDQHVSAGRGRTDGRRSWATTAAQRSGRLHRTAAVVQRRRSCYGSGWHGIVVHTWRMRRKLMIIFLYLHLRRERGKFFCTYLSDYVVQSCDSFWPETKIAKLQHVRIFFYLYRAIQVTWLFSVNKSRWWGVCCKIVICLIFRFCI